MRYLGLPPLRAISYTVDLIRLAKMAYYETSKKLIEKNQFQLEANEISALPTSGHSYIAIRRDY